MNYSKKFNSMKKIGKKLIILRELNHELGGNIDANKYSSLKDGIKEIKRFEKENVKLANQPILFSVAPEVTSQCLKSLEENQINILNRNIEILLSQNEKLRKENNRIKEHDTETIKILKDANEILSKDLDAVTKKNDEMNLEVAKLRLTICEMAKELY